MADKILKPVPHKTQAVPYLNGAATNEIPSVVTQRRSGARGSQKAPAIADPDFDWRSILKSNGTLGGISLVISICGVLYSAGWIPPIAKQTDVSLLATQVVEMRGAVEGLAKEFRETRVEIVKASTSIAKIEGRLEAGARVERPAKARVAKAAPPPKPKGLFD